MHIRFEDLELGPLLGSGTVGAVYRAKLKSSGEMVAVKLLHLSISRDKLVRSRFRREMQILEKLKHPNIVHYLGGGDHGGQLFYVMEALELGNAKEMLEKFGSLTWQEVASIARQVSSALQYAHNQGIVHRDLKPSNLFLTESGLIKLGDFGIARDVHAADLTETGLTVGTHAYMSPEQIMGEQNITGKADLYSLGCVMFELLTGRTPFQGANFAVLFEQHLRKPAPPVSDYVADCPPALAATIAQLLEKEPDRRPFNARAVQAAMLKLFDDPVSQPLSADAHHAKNDVPAAAVSDPGMQRLAMKLAAAEPQQISWSTLSLIALAVLGLILFAAFASR